MSRALWLSRSATKRTSPSNSTSCVAIGWLTSAPFESTCVSIAIRMSLMRSATFFVPSSCSLMAYSSSGSVTLSPATYPMRSGSGRVRRSCRGFDEAASGVAPLPHADRGSVYVGVYVGVGVGGGLGGAVGDVLGPRVRHEQPGPEADDEARPGRGPDVRGRGDDPEGQGAQGRDDEADERCRAEAETHVEAPRLRRRDRPADGEGGDGEPGDDRRGARRALEEGRDVGGEADEHGSDADADEARRNDESARQDLERQHRLRCAPLDEAEDDEQDGTDGEGSDALPRAPRPGLAALEDSEDEQRQRDREHAGPGVVDAVSASLDRLVVVAPQHARGEQAEGDVDEEDPPPRRELGEDAAERGTDDGRHGPHARDVALGLGALGHGVDVGGDRRRHGQHGTGSEALEGSHDDERAHVPSEPAEDAADEEESDPDED